MTREFQWPASHEYHEFYEKYIQCVDPKNFFTQFDSQPEELRELLIMREEAELNCLHEPYTWSLKQVVGHLIDGERVFSDRMVRIAVGDDSPIPGIDQQMFVAAVDFSTISMEHLLDEFEHLRRANVLATQKYSDKALSNYGVAADANVTALANLYILVGHVAHHLKIIKTRLKVD